MGAPFAAKLDAFPGAKQVRALWFDPRTGEEAVFAILPPEGSNFFVPPTQGKGCDWVLILEAVRCYTYIYSPRLPAANAAGKLFAPGKIVLRQNNCPFRGFSI